MQLTFEEVAIIGAGSYPDFVQFERTEGELFFIDDGLMYGTSTEKLNGDFTDPPWTETFNITPVNNADISLLELKTLSGFGIVGSYKTPTAQKLLIYEFQYDMSKYLSSGSIKHSIDSPISSFALTLENIVDEETEIEGPVIMNEKFTLLSPGAKVIFGFSMGEDYIMLDMGSFYIDRSQFAFKSETASVDGRNLIGKALKDQTLNENNIIPYDTITNILDGILEDANLGVDQYQVQNESIYRRFNFEPSKTVYGALEEILQSMITWKMEETVDGEIIIGDPTYSLFPSRSTYSFHRGQDIFSRDITMDDQESYRKVCVHNGDWTVVAYEDVVYYSGWNLQSNKTLFVEVSTGTTQANAEAIALQLAGRLESVGKVETFTGPFRPQLLVGDGATIQDEDGNTELGLITEITHNFGKSGFSTTFVVDSGGRLGRGSLSDFIRVINNEREVGSVFYEDIPAE